MGVAGGFDARPAAVVAGDGVVARFPGVLVVAAGPDPAVARLLEICRAAAGADPGRPLARRLAGWLGGADQIATMPLRFGTVAAGEGGLAVFLHGAVEVRLPGSAVAVRGADAAAWVDRLLDTADPAVVLALAGTVAPDAPGGPFDLRSGVVPGAGVVLAAASRLGGPVAGVGVGAVVAGAVGPGVVGPAAVAAGPVDPGVVGPGAVGLAAVAAGPVGPGAVGLAAGPVAAGPVAAGPVAAGPVMEGPVMEVR